MRDLELNKSTWFVVEPLSITDVIDIDGNYTGEKTTIYSEPISISINILPRNGDIIERMFGKDSSVDMVGVTTDIVLTKDSLLFSISPTTDEYTTYDYKVSSIIHSLNGYLYGLRGRVK